MNISTCLRAIVFCLFLAEFSYCFANDPGYPEIFGENWTKATQFVSENKEWMAQTCSLFDVDYNLATAIIFPELLRYSALRDRMEVSVLKSIYVYKGADYADFSVGVYQIKPSCAEKVIIWLNKLNIKELSGYFNRRYSFKTPKSKRNAIVNDLEDTHRAFLYVVSIVKILETTFTSKIMENETEKVRFFATAYNTGFHKNYEEIESQVNIKSFHTKIVKPGNCYSYSDIALFFYSRQPH